MSLWDKIAAFLTVVFFFVGIPALFVYGGYRLLTREKWLLGSILMLVGGALFWASYQFMYNVGPHSR